MKTLIVVVADDVHLSVHRRNVVQAALIVAGGGAAMGS
jgi:hypothetical protein